MTGLICSVINQSRNPRWAGSLVSSVLASRAAADLSLILPDKGICGRISLTQTLLSFTWMLLFNIWDEEVVFPPLSDTSIASECTPCIPLVPYHLVLPHVFAGGSNKHKHDPQGASLLTRNKAFIPKLPTAWRSHGYKPQDLSHR